MIERDKWEWFGMAGHYVCRHQCQFHLCTVIGDYMISSVGARVETQKSRDWVDIGSERKFETMVFKLNNQERCAAEGCLCEMPIDWDGNQLETRCCNTPGECQKHHMELCLKYAQLQ